ncbi:MAG: aminoacyl-tRNA hydrolase [Candidatus Melainabacteria bacterium]|nr:aminoacyl-tRNA hydrolase [Candidatus Melainabacteria bacterium]
MQSKLIIGLGNPSGEHENTRHNVGFALLDAFGEKYQIVGKQEDKLLSWYGKGKLKFDNINFNVILAWPTTFMNHSGDAAVKLLNWFKLKPNDLIVVHDDVALNLGKIRISFNSGAAGHHGVESIIQMLGGVEEFTRLRIGIGPDPGGDKRADYVLRKFSPDEKKLLGNVMDTSIQAIETIIVKNVGEAMNKFNGKEITSI